VRRQRRMANCRPEMSLALRVAATKIASRSLSILDHPVRANQTRLPALGLLPLEFCCSASAPAGCLLQLIHGLDEGARGAKSQSENCNKQSEGFSIQATLSPDSLRSGLKRAGQSAIDRVDSRHRMPVGFPASAMPPPDCTCVAGHAMHSSFLRLAP
jgi:hypothetical protein